MNNSHQKPFYLGLSMIILLQLFILSCCSNVDPEIVATKNVDDAHLIFSEKIFIGFNPDYLPTSLSDQERDEFIIHLFNEDSCDLPCQANLTPGVSTVFEAQQYLSGASMSIFVGNATSVDEFFLSFYYDATVLDYSQDQIGVNITSADGLFISSIEMLRYQLPIDEVLQRYGEPTNIYLYITPGLVRGGLEYEIYLYYPVQHFLVTYWNTIFPTQLDSFELCPVLDQSSSEFLYIHSWSPSIVEMNFLPFLADPDMYFPLEEIANTTTADFYTAVIDSQPGNECFIVQNPHEVMALLP